MRCSLAIRTDRPDKAGQCVIELIFQHRGKRIRYPSGLRVLPANWSLSRRRVMRSDNRHADINARLAKLEAQGKELEVTHADATLERIAALLRAGTMKIEGSFTDMARTIVKADKDLAWHTTNTWLPTLDKLDLFAPGIGLSEMDQPLMKRYLAWAVRGGNQHNTAAKNVRNIRTMYRRVCELKGLDPKPIAQKLDITERLGAPKFVPLDRIQDVLNYRTDRTVQQLAVDLWCFSFACAGIRFLDLVGLRWKQFEDGWLAISEQHKTGHFKRSELTPRAEAILARYRGGGGTYVFKVCGDRKVTEKEAAARLSVINPELHAISAELGITPRMTTHTARHSWTEWALVNKVPYPLMMQMLGIKSMKSFLHYISRFNTEAVSDVYGMMREAFPITTTEVTLPLPYSPNT